MIPKTILITGASSGFALLMAKTLATAGHHVYVSMRGVDHMNALAGSVQRDFMRRMGIEDLLDSAIPR